MFEPRNMLMIIAAITLARGAIAGDTLRRSDLVQIRSGKYISEEYALCQIKRPESFGASPKFQTHLYAEAPAKGVISRDNFVAYQANILTMLQVGMAQRAGVYSPQTYDAMKCQPLEAAIGTVDLEIKIVMTSEGMQLEVIDTSSGRVTRSTTPWD